MRFAAPIMTTTVGNNGTNPENNDPLAYGEYNDPPEVPESARNIEVHLPHPSHKKNFEICD